jgi:O-acetyl-ADP-ribose deacetylase (regulator of RNase III)
MVRYLSIDILDTKTELIAHQVNCKGVMGAGLARQIRAQFPAVYKAYHRACSSVAKSSDLLGKIQIKQGVVNLFAQDGYGTDKQYTDYKALETCLYKLASYMTEHKMKTLALPYGLGCGLGGGDWKVVHEIIRDIFTPSEITVYICKN